MSTDAFAHFFKISDSNTVSDTPIRSIALTESSPMAPAKRNFMLNQGHYIAHDGDLFLGFDYSSHLVQIDLEGIDFVNDAPAKIPFPHYDRQAGSVYEAPNSAEFPECTMGITVDEQHAYVLHHGRTFDIGPVRQLVAMARGRIAAKIEEWELTNRVFVYSRDNGAFIREIKLPVKARRIRVTKQYMYVLTIEDGPATIIKYRKPHIDSK